MPIFDEGGHAGEARSTIFDAIGSLFDKDKDKKKKFKPQFEQQKFPEDELPEDKKDSSWF